MYPVYGAPVYGAPVYGAPVPGYTPAVVATSAAHAMALDAADGVIDGRIGGMPIAGGAVYGAPAPVYYGAPVYAPPAVIPTQHIVTTPYGVRTTHVSYY